MAQVLEVVHADAEQLLNYVEDASHVAEGISHTVKALDTTQSNVKSALDHIKLLTDRSRLCHTASHTDYWLVCRSSCVLRLRESMDKGEYESAAECIARFHSLENELAQPPETHQRQVATPACSLWVWVIGAKDGGGI